MAQRFKDEAGNIWEMGANGQPSLVSPAAGPSLTNPLLAPQVKKATNEAVASQSAPAIASADATIKTAEAANARDVANANRDKAIAEAKTAEFNSRGGPRVTADVRKAAIQQYNYAQQLQETVDELNQLYLKGPGATSGIEGLKDFLPNAANKNFDTKANAARGIVGQTLNFTGGQLNTPQESEKAVGPYLPQSGNFDSTIVQKIQTLQELANHGKQNAVQTLGGVPDANGNVTPVPAAPDAPSVVSAPDAISAATGRTHEVVDPALKAVSLKVGYMLANGTPGTEISAFLTKNGVDPASTDLSARLKYRATPEFKTWQRANPGAPYPMDRSMFTRQVPMTPMRQLFNKTAATDLGGDLSAGIVATGNSVSGGRLGKFAASQADDPAMAQTGMELLRTNHPLSSLGGDVAGQALFEASLGRIPGAQGLMASRWGRRGADALYGAYSGSGETDGDPTVGGLTGAATNMFGGMFGRGVQKGIGKAATGILDPSLQYLHQAGIPLTVGRIARGVGEIDPHGPTNIADEVGKGVGGIEERLMGLPGLDAIIGTARQRGDAAFNNEAFRQIAPGVTGRGAEGLASAKAAETAAYSKLNDVRLAVDPIFHDGIGAIQQSSAGLLHHSKDVSQVVGDIRGQISDGEMTGKGYQTALQAIRRTRAGLNDDVGGHAADALNALEQQVVELGARQSGQVGQDLAEANAIHTRRQIIKLASKGSAAQGAGEMFSPKSLNQMSINNTTKFGGLDKALSTDRPLYDLTHAGMGVMPNLTPDSGTAGRLQLYRGLGAAGAGIGGGIGALTGAGGSENAAEGGGIGLGGGVALGALLSAPYSHVGQKLIQNTLLGKRPDRMVKLGEFLIRNPKYAGMFGSGLARDYAYQPELPQ
jgi:hypothetical protein